MSFYFKAPKRAVYKVYIHCSASDNPAHASVDVIRKWHTTKDPRDPSKPWSDIGYHYVMPFDGTIHPGRNLEASPASQAPYNKNTVSICVCGGQDGLDKAFTEAQYNALRSFAQAVHAALPSVTFHGHCEVSNRPCPVLDYRKILGLDDKGNLLTNRGEKQWTGLSHGLKNLPLGHRLQRFWSDLVSAFRMHFGSRSQ